MFKNAFNNIDRVLRNDEGLASELDYAEQTSWLLFLKYLDDLEAERRDNAELEVKTTSPSSTGNIAGRLGLRPSSTARVIPRSWSIPVRSALHHALSWSECRLRRLSGA